MDEPTLEFSIHFAVLAVLFLPASSRSGHKEIEALAGDLTPKDHALAT
ncbi:hypothetical protein [Cupriavidus lacunae]|nr:hypothetical protein [Cupriavidus lacunae]